MPGTVVAVEGGLLPPDLLDRIAAGETEDQDAPAFGLTGNRRLIDEVQRAFSDARAEWDAFQVRLGRSRESVTTLTRQYWATPFPEILGFQSLRTQRGHIEAGGQRYDISHIAGEADDAPPVHIVACGQALDARVARRSPHNSVQEYLNRSDAVWGLVTNGEQLRLLRDSERFTRPTYVEFDLCGIFDGNQYAEFALAYRLLHRTRFPTSGAEVADSWLEKYFHLGIDEGGRVRERLRDGVEKALHSLGQGILAHSRSGALREALAIGRLDVADYYRQLLRLVYRLLFLMVAEERRLIFPEDGGSDDRTAAYLRYYSVAALRERCERYFIGDDHHDLWLGLLQTFRMFRNPGAAEPLGLAPVDGELFGERACSDLERAACSNEALLSAMLNLSTFLDDDAVGMRRCGRRKSSRGVRRRVNYAALDVEELGSVYEALLDLQPRIEPPTREGGYPSFDLVAGSERKQTGSYYTPPYLVNELVGSALVPVMEERLAEAGSREERERALLSLRVLDPASGSGHFLLVAARRIAIDLAQARAGDDGYSPAEYREAQRDVIRHCIYAVDKNPLAVDLCKVALWIESHSPGLPLSFLDHHVKCGDSLVGVGSLEHLQAGIPDGAFKAIGGDDKAAATSYRRRNRAERRGQLGFGRDPAEPAAWADDFETFADLEERSPGEVRAKEDLYTQLRGDGTRWWDYKTACDLWTYAFFAPLQPAGLDGIERVPTTNDVRDALGGSTRLAKLIGAAVEAAQTQRFFHWPLEFPDVFQRGGFDVVLGNPPWDRYRLAEREFFAVRDPEIASARAKNWAHAPVRFDRYTGETKQEDRERIIHERPHILLTNYVMLEYLLVRQVERSLLETATRDLRILVMDELHVYRGRQGADVAMLVRRVSEKAGRPLQVIGTSATLATGSNRDERRTAIADVASRLFGVELAANRVVEETLRRIATVDVPAEPADVRAAVDLVPPSVDGGVDEVALHPLAAWAERAFGIDDEDGRLVRRAPTTFASAVERLAKVAGLPREHCQDRLRAVLEAGNKARTRTDDPLFAFRLHQFISSGSSVYATLEPGGERKLSMDGRYDAGDGKTYFPLAFCRECGQEYFLVGRIEGDAGDQLVPRSPMVGALDEDVRGTAGYFAVPRGEDDDLWSGVSEELPDHWLRVRKNSVTVKPEYLEHVPVPFTVGADGQSGGTTDGWYQPRPRMICLRCRTAWDRTNRSDFTKLSSLSQTGRSTSATVTVNALVAEMAAQDSPKGERKVLSFTDNRQDAALQAGHLNDFVQVAQVRAAIVAAIEQRGRLDYAELGPALFEALDLDPVDFLAEPAAEGTPGYVQGRSALVGLLEYLALEDLGRGWRVTQANLEQAGLLRIGYQGLAQLAADDQRWRALPGLGDASAEDRERVLSAILDHLRTELCIDAPVLTRDQTRALARRAQQWLRDPWAVEEGELRTHMLALLPGEQPTWQEERGRFVRMGWRSALGRYLRDPRTWDPAAGPSDASRLDPDETDALVHGIVAGLRGQLLTVERSSGSDHGVRVKADVLDWMQGDGSSAPPSAVRSRSLHLRREIGDYPGPGWFSI